MVPPPGEDFTIVQGTVRSWNPATFENVIDIDGQRFEDVPSGLGVDGLTVAPGEEVLVGQWFPGGAKGELGLGSMWVDKRIIMPGTGAAEQTIAFLSTQLARSLVDELVAELLVSPAGVELAAFVLGQRVHTDVVEGQEGTTSTSFTDLATAGPSVAGVDISDAGVALVFTNAGILGGGNSSLNSAGGAMSFAVTGASSVSADLNNSRSLQHGVATGDMGDVGTPSTISRSASMTVVTGLNPGVHTFTAKYRALGSTGATGLFNQRSLAVIGL